MNKCLDIHLFHYVQAYIFSDITRPKFFSYNLSFYFYPLANIISTMDMSKEVIRVGLDEYMYINHNLQLIFEIKKSSEFEGIEVIVNKIYSMETQDDMNSSRIIFMTNEGQYINKFNAQSLIPIRLEVIGNAIYTFKFLDRFIFNGKNSRDVLEELLTIPDLPGM